jgi:hypothetical protein
MLYVYGFCDGSATDDVDGIFENILYYVNCPNFVT